MPPEQTDQRSSEQDNSLQDINSNVIDPRTAALTQARQQADERRQNIQHGHHTQTQRVATAIKLFPLADSVNFVHKELRFTSGMEMKVGRVSGSRNQRESKQDNGVFLCDVMSREHALLQEIDGKIWIKDMKSTHGTFINNYRIGNGTAASEFYPLKHKDVITFGHSVRRNQNLYKHLSAYVWYPSESGGMDPPFPVVLDRREINPAQNAPANNATTNGIGNGIVGNGVGNNYTARQRDIENGNTNTRLIPPHSNARPDHTDRTNNHSQPPVHRDIRTHTAPPQPQNQEPKTEAIEIESDAENDLIQERENAPEEKDKQPKSQQEEAASTSNDTNGVNNNNNSAVSNDNNVAKKEQVTSTILREVKKEHATSSILSSDNSVSNNNNVTKKEKVASDLVKKEHVTSISSTEKKEQVPPTTLKDVNKSKDHSHHSKSKESTIPNSKGFPLPKSKDSANIEQTKDPSSNERSITNHQNDVSKIPIPIATKSNELSDKRNRDPQLMEFEHNEIRNDNNQSESFDRKHDYQLSDVQRDMDLDEIKTDNDKMIKNDYGNKEERSLTARKRTYEEMENEGYEIVPSKEYVDELRRRLAVAERKRKRIKWEVVGTVIAGMLFGAGGVIVLGS